MRASLFQRLTVRTVAKQWTGVARRIGFSTRLSTVMLEVDVDVAVRVDATTELRRDRLSNRLRDLREGGAQFSVAKPRCDSRDACIHGEHWLAAGKEQHAVGGTVTAHARQHL